MKRLLIVLGGALALCSLPTVQASPGAHGPNGEHLDGAAAIGNATGLARLPDGSVHVPVPAQRRMGVRTQFARLADAAASVELAGRVVVDPNAGGRVQTVQGGRIEAGPKGLPTPGQAVRRGELLAYVRFHAEPFAQANQRAQLSELHANRALAEQRVRRLQALEGSVPRKEIEAAQAELQSLAARERDIGASLQAREALVAPVGGVIARAEVQRGQVVEPRDVLFEIVDPRRVLIEATTSDPALAANIASAQLEGVPGARLRLVGASRSLRDGVLPLTFKAQAEANGELPLALGQPVGVIVQLKTSTKGYVLPAQAVVRNSVNEPIVWIKSGGERYIPQPIQYRPLDSATVVVTQGLGDENRVVVQGAPLISQIR